MDHHRRTRARRRRRRGRSPQPAPRRRDVARPRRGLPPRGVLLGVPRIGRRTDRTMFGYAVLVAAVSGLFPVGLRVWTVLTARPDLALADASFVLRQFHVLVPFVVAFAAPLGVAERRPRRRFLAAVVAAPFVVAAVRGVAVGFGFGPAFAVLHYALVLLAGLVAGLPLYGRLLRDGSLSLSRAGSSTPSGTE